MNLKKSILSTMAFLGTAAVSASTALAQITNPALDDWGSNTEDAESGSLFVQIFIQVWNVIISVGALIVVVMFIWGAVEWISSGGDSGKVQNAQKRLTNAALGLFLLVASFAIIEFISLIFFDGEFSILNLNLPTPSGD